MFGEWAINQITPQSPGFWLLISLISGLIVLYLEVVGPKPRWRAIWAVQRILVPYLGLVLGALSPRLMGLNRVDWAATLGIGLVFIFAITMLLLLVRATVDLPDASEVRRHRAPVPTPPVPIRPAEQAGATRTGTWWQNLAGTILVCGAREFHWVFLRGALWEMLLSAPLPIESPGYWAVWIAAVLVLAETLLRRLSFAHTIFQVVIVICTGILFFYTLNFWLCWLLHTIVQIMAAPGSLQRPLPRPQWGAGRR